MSDHVGSWSVHKARKQHRCDWCSEPITPGNHYRSRFVVWDGSPWTMRVHPECAVAEGAFDYDGDELCFPTDFKRGHTHECNWDTVERCAASGCPACILLLPTSAEKAPHA